MARLYADENFPLDTVIALRRLGHTILTAHESGRSNQAISDAEVLTFATDQQMAVLTLNRRHFIRLHAERPAHAGMITCTFDPDVDGQAQRIHAAIGDREALHGLLLRVNRPTNG